MLKKAVLICSFVMMLLLVNVSSKPIFCGDGEYVLYLDSASSLCQQVKINSGKINEVYSSFKNIKGECLKAKNRSVIEDELTRLNARFVFSEKGEDFDTEYYYTDKISSYKTINGKKVNVQTAVYQDNYIIASPMIFGSF